MCAPLSLPRAERTAPYPTAEGELDVALKLATALARRVPAHVRDDARSEALLTWTTMRDRHDGARGSLSTFAFPRMRGSTLDLARRHNQPVHRHARPVVSADLVASGTLTAQVALRQALLRLDPVLESTERSVLDLVYRQGMNLAEAGQACGRTADAMERANRRLIDRLRAWMQVQGAL
ncbi:MAG: hypothetical protein FJ100_06975 [Deltaproteobacteria bacterium]|nr:hypothetical protein [Deltaproteobacteria bacterium]